jgi:hypothetical protein
MGVLKEGEGFGSGEWRKSALVGGSQWPVSFIPPLYCGAFVRAKGCGGGRGGRGKDTLRWTAPFSLQHVSKMENGSSSKLVMLPSEYVGYQLNSRFRQLPVVRVFLALL